MPLGLLEVVRTVERIQPLLEEELRPFAVLDDHAIRDQASSVLAYQQRCIFCLEMPECLNDAVGHHRRLWQHDLGEPALV
jgi:hypothetical protein